jgi:L-asparaginase II
MEALIVAGGIVGVQLAAGLGAGLLIALKVLRGPQRQSTRSRRTVPAAQAQGVSWKP